MLITDAQVHVWAPEALDRPWPPAGSRPRPQGAPFSPAQLLERMIDTGVDRAVLVPPSFEGDRNDVCLAAAAAHPHRFRVMGRLDLADPGGRTAVACWRAIPGMVGIRLTFGFGESARWLRDGTADWFWPVAEAAGVPVMLYPPGQLADVARVAGAHPGLRLIVDHLGVHPRLRDEEIDAPLEDLRGLARFDNVAVKATCLPTLVSDGYPFRSLHGRIRRIVDSFGAHRVFWGSDLTRLSCSYREVKALFTEELDFLDGHERELVMGKAIGNWLGWEG